MTSLSRTKKIVWVVLCLGLVIWGLTDVRKRAHYDPVASAKNRWLLMDHRTDLSVYTWAGAAFFDERDPYEVVNPRGWKYLYPPLFAILMAPLNFFPPQWQGVVWYFLSLLMAWGCYRETVRLYHLCGKTAGTSQKKESRTVRWILAGTVATVLFPALDCLQRGQVGILILYLLLLGFRLVMENRAPLKVAAGGMVLALAVTFKIIPLLPALFLLYLLLVRRLTRPASGGTGFQEWSAAGGMALGLVLFVFIIPSLFLGWQANWKYLNVWTAKVGVHAVEISQDSNFSNPTSPRNQSLNNAMYHAGNRVAYWFSRGTEPTPWDFRDNRNRFMNSPTAVNAVLGIRIILILLLIPLGWRIARKGDLLEWSAVYGLACLASLMVSPIARGHYFVQALPAVLFMALWIHKREGERISRFAAGIPALLSLIHYALMKYTASWGMLGLGITLWYVFMVIWLTPSASGDSPKTSERASST